MPTTQQPRYLILDNALHRRLLPEGTFTQRLLGCPADVYYAAGGHFPDTLDGYAGVILSGSEAAVPEERPWFEGERRIVRACLEADVPLLGICFGAQFMSGVVWGVETVRRMAPPEVGWVRIACDASNPLFRGLTSPFVAWSAHHWGFAPAAPSLAQSRFWGQQAFQVPGRRAWGVQFHPEVGWGYGTLFDAWEKLQDPSLPMRAEGRPDRGAARRIVANLIAVAEAPPRVVRHHALGLTPPPHAPWP